MGDEPETKKKRVGLESLGWLTESSVMPKKHRAIEGVGASSILELKAQLYKSQEESKRDRLSSDLHVHRPKQKITPRDPFSAKNSGVEARATKDKLELKAIKDGAASYAALEKKAELYDKLVRGEVSDEEDQEKYSVDFFRKGLEQDKSKKSPGHKTPAAGGLGHDHGDGVDDDVLGISNIRPAETSSMVDRQEHTRFVM